MFTCTPLSPTWQATYRYAPLSSCEPTSSSELVAVALLLALALGGLDPHLLIVLLQGSQVLAGLRELTLLHTLADVPVNEGALGVHQIELVVNPREHLRDGSGVRDHANRTHHLRQVATRHHGRGLVVDAALEPGRGPVHELNGALRLDRGHRGIHVLRHHVAAVHHAARHVLPVPGIALHHHRG